MTDYVKEFSKFDSESLAYIINKYAWREQKEILQELRYLRWEKEEKKHLELRKKENAETTRLAEEKSKMPRNTDKEILAYLEKDREYWDKIDLYLKRQNARAKKLNKLYEEID